MSSRPRVTSRFLTTSCLHTHQPCGFARGLDPRRPAKSKAALVHRLLSSPASARRHPPLSDHLNYFCLPARSHAPRPTDNQRGGGQVPGVPKPLRRSDDAAAAGSQGLDSAHDERARPQNRDVFLAGKDRAQGNHRPPARPRCGCKRVPGRSRALFKFSTYYNARVMRVLCSLYKLSTLSVPVQIGTCRPLSQT